MSMNQSFWNKAAIYGILLALVSVFFMVLQSVLTPERWMNILFWIVKLAGTLGLLFYFMKDFGKGKDSYTYSDSFKFGLAVSFCSSIIAAAYYYIHMMFLFFPFTRFQSCIAVSGLQVYYGLCPLYYFHLFH